MIEEIKILLADAASNYTDAQIIWKSRKMQPLYRCGCNLYGMIYLCSRSIRYTLAYLLHADPIRYTEGSIRYTQTPISYTETAIRYTAEQGQFQRNTHFEMAGFCKCSVFV